MKIISWNVNGIRAAYKKGTFNWLQNEKPDIFCVQETKAQPEQLIEEILAPEGYKSYFHSAVRKGYSGVAVYSSVEPSAVQNGFGIDEYDIEGRVLRVDFDNFVLFNVYFPNGKAKPERLKYKMDFNYDFFEYLKNLRSEGKKVIVCGDVNTAHKEIDLARPKANEKTSGFLPEERKWIDQLIAAGFVDTFRVFNQEPENYTWWDVFTRARERNVGWRIDYFFASEDLLPDLKNAFIMQDVFGSAHCPIGIELT